ncbi:hypothetical protein FHR83_008099 [Actinoplanes campanulatus]|uniref:Uncharacterized protein n=1 Tax=Actinoplanes campanulatus TaxID=113559 RepID=A0A7W5FJ97_9ACTN|nr:hypothetical protein [Actinoplanes campanulatus]MBB3100377.1 hypothetical protein [Actinoplanes campanulatus]GGN24497.1 hypothetical protein GCM10010109_40040 [Actinoplanes campanulatus]GID39584.1 hypothetical protein Aca09nite_60900 [Actinoplanes campanulatus]
MSDEWLDNAEVLVLQPLEDSPLPLWELRWHEVTTVQQLADILAPGLISLATRGFVEVRRFHNWPAQWDEGLPLTGDDLARESTRAAVWSDSPEGVVLAAHITEAGRRLL